VVRSARERDGHTILKIGYGRSDVIVQVPALIHGSDLVDQEFTATGVLGMVFNNRRQAIGHRLFVPSREFLLPVAGQPSQSGVLTIDSLQRYRPDDDQRHTVTLNGTVVLKTAPDSIFVQDQTAGIQVRGAGPLDVSPGDRVSVRGFVVPGEYSPALEDATVSRGVHAQLPDAKRISSKEAAEGQYDSRYVSVRGVLTAIRQSTDETILLLNDHGTFFQAFGPANANFSWLRPGSEIDIRGVCRVSFDQTRQSINGFMLNFDSPESPVVIRSAPWWNTHNITWALFAIIGFAMAVSLCVLLLRRKVDMRTRELKKSIDARHKAQQFDAARNKVLEAIARNAPPPESMEFLALAVQEQIEGSVCAIAISPEGKASLNGASFAILIAPNFPEEVQRQTLPAVTFAFNHYEAAGEVCEQKPELMKELLEIFSHSGLELKDGEVINAYSGSGAPAGLLMIFWGKSAPADVEGVARVLQSASRLVSLAGDHWHMHQRLLYEARHDVLTGLPNRNVAEEPVGTGRGACPAAQTIIRSTLH
jgi:hypothetical protein